MILFSRSLCLILALSLAACASPARREAREKPPEAPVTVVEAPEPGFVEREAPLPETAEGDIAVADLPGWAQDDHEAALSVFRKSCTKLVARDALWQRPCHEAVSTRRAKAFFEQHFVAHAMPEKDARGGVLFTGYYEPELKGSRAAGGAYRVPVYRMPTQPSLRNLTRKQIEAGALKGKGLEVAWVSDPVELFFLQVQGSGRIILEDGGVIRVGYEGNNGHSYVSLGKVMQQKGYMEPGKISSPSIKAWLRANPEKAASVMQENPRYIFFRERPGATEGPIGSLGVGLTPERSAAVDGSLVPAGAPLYVITRLPSTPQGGNARYQRLLIAQDSGAGVKDGHVDIFFGHGPRAEELAGYMSIRGRAYILTPRDDRS